MALTYIRNIITSGYNVLKINDNFQKIETAILSGLSRTSASNNQMNVDLDMNGNDIMNIHTIDATNFSFEGVDFEQMVDDAEAAAISATASAATATTQAGIATTQATNANNSAIAAAASAAVAASVITTATVDNTIDDTDNIAYSTGSTIKRAAFAAGFITSLFNGTRTIANILATSTARIVDAADTTKRLAFNVAGITTATTRTITVPNTDLLLGRWETIDVQDFTGQTSIIFNGTLGSYRTIRVTWSLTSDTVAATPAIQIGTGLTWVAGTNYSFQSCYGVSSLTAAQAGNNTASPSIQIAIGETVALASEGACGDTVIHNFNQASNARYESRIGLRRTASSNYISGILFGGITNAVARNSLQFLFSAAMSGRVTIEGIRG